LAQILDLIEMRAVLESYMVRKSAPNLDKAAMKRLRQICDETDQLRDYGSRWVVKNWDFHRILYSTGSQAMIDAVERIHLHVERYARLAGTAARQKQAAAEHRQIVQAIEKKDYEKASALTERHVLNTGEDIRRHLEQDAQPAEVKVLTKRRSGSR
jgi:DNA-binding GntR family transcriptional regulator